MTAKEIRWPYRKIVSACRTAIAQHGIFRMRAFDKREYEFEDGSVYELFVIERKRALVGRPRVFVIAGFHGEEPAGPMAIARGIKSWLAYAAKHELNLTIVPCANPWGYDRNIRNTPHSVYTNAGYAHEDDVVSDEFVPLKKLLQSTKIEYYIDLHEDDTDPKGSYVYAFGDQDVATRVLAAMTSQDIPLDAKPETDDPLVAPHIIGRGLVYEAHDGSSDDMVSHKRENISVIVPEVPSLTYPLNIRASAHMRGVAELLKIAANTKHEA